jgi:hypothetical protein
LPHTAIQAVGFEDGIWSVVSKTQSVIFQTSVTFAAMLLISGGLSSYISQSPSNLILKVGIEDSSLSIYASTHLECLGIAANWTRCPVFRKDLSCGVAVRLNIK